MKKLLFVVAAIVFFALVLPLGFYPAYAETPTLMIGPTITIGPTPTYTLDFVVNIPDANLRTALHNATGVPTAEDIYVSDLAALTGSLYLGNKGIADATGIQYCKKITTLNLGGNSLTTLPANMSGMAALETLYLNDNAFATMPNSLFSIPKLVNLNVSSNPISEVPSGISGMTKLQSLYMVDCSLTDFPTEVLALKLKIIDFSENDIQSLPANISNLTMLEGLYMNDTGLETLPDSLFTMTTVRYIQFQDNALTSLPEAISGMTGLAQLNVSGNKLQSLPDALCDLPHLFVIQAGNNRLYSLPGDIGDAPVLTTLLVKGNRIGALPGSLCDSDTIDMLDVSVNRLIALPSDLDEVAFVEINVEWNFLDVSAGSDAREIMEDVSADTKSYMHQFALIGEVETEATVDSITLTWEGGEDGADGYAEWEVTGYVVYVMENGEMVELDSLSKTTLTYTHTGLAPQTEYEYRIGVDYDVVMPYFNGENRGYTTVLANTLSSKDEPSDSHVWNTETASPSGTAPSESSSGEGTEGKGMSTLGIVLIGAGALILGAGVTLVILNIKKGKK